MSTSPTNSAARALASMALPFPAASGEHGYTCKPALPDEPSLDREQRVMHVPLAASSESALVRAREVARLAWSPDVPRTSLEAACEQARLHLLMGAAGIALDEGFAEEIDHVAKRATAHAVAGERARAVERVLAQGFTVRESRAIDSAMRRASTDAARAGAAATVRHLEVVGLSSAAALSVLASGDKHDHALPAEAARAAHAVLERERLEDERRAEEERKRREAEAERRAQEARERAERESAERRAREEAERKESEPSDSAGDGEASEGPGTGDTSDAERPAPSSAPKPSDEPSPDEGAGDAGEDAGDAEGEDAELDDDEGAAPTDTKDAAPKDSEPSDDAGESAGESDDAGGEPGDPSDDAGAGAADDAHGRESGRPSDGDLESDGSFTTGEGHGGGRTVGARESAADREAREREERERIERARAEDAARAAAEAERAREIAVREQMAEDERRRAQERLREQRARASIVAAEREEAALARAAADAAREHAALIERLEAERAEHDERERAYKGDLALAAQLVEDGVSGIRRDGHQTRWCRLVMDTGCPMPVRIAKIEAPRRRWSSEGMYLRAPHRLFSDGAAFVQYGGGREGGSVLIDVSGSMALSVETVERIVRAAPAVSVAIYASDGNREGWLRVVARNGRMVAPEHLRFDGGGNGVDGPALREWLAKQPHPRIWVCDGCVTGVGDQTGRALGDECVATVRRLGIARVGTPERALALFGKINPKSKRARAR